MRKTNNSIFVFRSTVGLSQCGSPIYLAPQKGAFFVAVQRGMSLLSGEFKSGMGDSNL